MTSRMRSRLVYSRLPNSSQDNLPVRRVTAHGQIFIQPAGVQGVKTLPRMLESQIATSLSFYGVPTTQARKAVESV